LYENGKEAKKSLNDLARAREVLNIKKIDKVTCMYLSVKLIIIRVFSSLARDIDDKSVCDRLKEMNQMNVHQQAREIERETDESEKKEF
jgi:bifunctional DNA-binding transcriptional regulator/antitoxin component of YhaV-PrlF toxin-antitoxin module